MAKKKLLGLLRISGPIIFVSGGGWFLYQIYKTRYTLSQTVKTDVLYQKKKADYIYIHDPEFHVMYDRKHTFDEERKQRTWLSALSGCWKSLNRSYSWRLVSMAQSENKEDRMKAIQLLVKLKSMKDSDYRHVAQMCDAQTAVGLARSEGVDLRFFLKPPYSHKLPSKKELTDQMFNLLIELNGAKNHPCINYFLSKAFPEFQYRHIVFDSDLATMELPQFSIRENNILPLSIESLLHHSNVEDNAKYIVPLGGLPLIVNLCQYYQDNVDISILLVNILSNISAYDGMLTEFFTAGCIGLLAKWSQNPNIRLSLPAMRALSNLDMDDSPEIKFPAHLYLLHPVKRHTGVPKLDVVFIHGLLGGVFFTWRQRDPERSALSLLVSFLTEGATNEFDWKTQKHRKVSDKRTTEYLDGVTQLKKDEWEEVGSDFEVVLSDCPENDNFRGDGPYSYSGCHPCIRQSMEDYDSYSLCWPRDWLSQDCHHLRIIGVNYDTNLSMWAPMCPIEKVKRNLDYRSKELMMKLKQAGLGSRPIVWVAHSMGGLLVKNMLIKAWQDEDEQLQKMCHNTKAIVFYSVPHRGSPIVNLTQATQLLWWPSVEVQELQENSPALLKLHSEFLNVLEKEGIEIISFGETKRTLLSTLRLQFHFVPIASSNPGVGEFFEIPQDHLCICKPDSRQSFLYQKLLHLIKKYMPTDDVICSMTKHV